MAKEKRQRQEARKETDKDISQDYEIKQLKKTVAGLSASTTGWISRSSTAGTYVAIPTLVGVNEDTSMLPFVQHLPAGILQGDLQDGRQGDYIDVNLIQIRYQVRRVFDLTGTNLTTETVRVMLVCSYSPNGVPGDAAGALVPQFIDLFACDSTVGGAMTRGSIRMLYNPEQRVRHHVYYDRIHTFVPQAGDTDPQGTNEPFAEGFIHVIPNEKNGIVKYNTTTAAADAQEVNMWYLLVMSDNATAADALPPVVTWKAVTTFKQ